MHADRQIAIWGGIAGPSFGVAMMAAPEYLHLQLTLAPLCFWGGIIVFVVTVFIVAALLRREREERHKAMWPIVVMALGMIIFGIGAAGYFWPSEISGPQKVAEVTQPTLDIRFEPRTPYETSEVASGHVLSAVKLGLKAEGRPLLNCSIFIEKMAPEAKIVGGLPIRLEGSGFNLRPDDPEKVLDIAYQWEHMSQFRFSSPIAPVYGGALNYLDDNIERTIEIKIAVGAEFQKTATFKIWTDAAKKLHLQRM
jgi:hypothetical protein